LRRRRTAHYGLVTSLGGPNIIMPHLGALLARGIHEPKEDNRVNIRHRKIVKKKY
jgi:hypothetical protein